MIEMEHIEQITERGAVQWNIRIIVIHNRVGEVVPAPMSQRLQSPVPLDELEDGNMISVSVIDVAASGKRRDDDERNARSIAKEIDWLNVA